MNKPDDRSDAKSTEPKPAAGEPRDEAMDDEKARKALENIAELSRKLPPTG